MNYKITSFLLGVVGVLSTVAVYGQQDPQYTQYMYNTMTVNPAYAGSRGHSTITALGRLQWLGVEGAPSTQNLTYDTLLGLSDLGLGVNLVNDKIGPSHEIYLDASASYRLTVGNEKYFSFGLRLGGRQLNIDWSKGLKEQQNDPAFQSNINRFLPTLGAGVYYNTSRWYLGVSVPNFLRQEHYDAKEELGIVAVERTHFFLITGYVFDLYNGVKFKPAVLFKGVAGSPISMDVSANLLFNEVFRAGISWRWQDSVSGMLGFQITDSLLIGYSYDLTTSNYNVVNSGAHELMLRYDIFKQSKRYESPRFF